jgi:RNA polymerase sigma-70 factor (ECF subfamily)
MTSLRHTPRKPPTGESSDHSLLARFRRGSEDAATQLYLRYAQRLRAFARSRWTQELGRRLDVEDVLQSVFSTFFQRARGGYYDVPEGEELWQLFLVLALNKIRNKLAFHQAARRDVRLTLDGEWFDQPAAQALSDHQAAYGLLQLTIDEALDQLPTWHKTMVELRLQGHEVADIARLTGRSRRSVERVLQESRQTLKDLLQEKDGHG